MKFMMRPAEVLTTIGFGLITASIVYFIIGNVVSVVHGDMLDWTFCGSAHHWFDVEWCGIQGETSEPAFNHFIHRLMNVTIPWFMMFWGFLFVGIGTLAMKLFGYKYHPPVRN